MEICARPECDSRRHAGEYCSKHYSAWKRWGDFENHSLKPSLCTIDGCDRKHVAKGYCRMHWKRQHYGSLPMEAPARFQLFPQNEHERREHRSARVQARRAVSTKVIHVQDVIAEYGSDCHLCNMPINLYAPRRAQDGPGWERGLHLDHVLPLSKGGTHTIENVKPAHVICNLRKGSK